MILIAILWKRALLRWYQNQNKSFTLTSSLYSTVCAFLLSRCPPYHVSTFLLPWLIFTTRLAPRKRSLSFLYPATGTPLPQCSKLFWFPFPSALEHVILVCQIFRPPDFRQYLRVRDVRSFLTVANCHSGMKRRLCVCPLERLAHWLF
jgi:hypothetical protein